MSKGWLYCAEIPSYLIAHGYCKNPINVPSQYTPLPNNLDPTTDFSTVFDSISAQNGPIFIPYKKKAAEM